MPEIKFFIGICFIIGDILLMPPLLEIRKSVCMLSYSHGLATMISILPTAFLCPHCLLWLFHYYRNWCVKRHLYENWILMWNEILEYFKLIYMYVLFEWKHGGKLKKFGFSIIKRFRKKKFWLYTLCFGLYSTSITWESQPTSH